MKYSRIVCRSGCITERVLLTASERRRTLMPKLFWAIWIWAIVASLLLVAVISNTTIVTPVYIVVLSVGVVLILQPFVSFSRREMRSFLDDMQ